LFKHIKKVDPLVTFLLEVVTIPAVGFLSLLDGKMFKVGARSDTDLVALVRVLL